MRTPHALGLFLSLSLSGVALADTGGDTGGDSGEDPAVSCDLDGDDHNALYCEPVTGDCNDEDASVYPGATEIVGDGIDQDCDGLDPRAAGLELAGGAGTCGTPGPSGLATLVFSLLSLSARRRACS